LRPARRPSADVPDGADVPDHAGHRVLAHRLQHVRRRVRDDLLLPDRAPRRARLRGPHDSRVHDDSRVPRALLARASPRRRDRRDLLALRRRHVDHRLHDRLHPLMRNPLRSEGEAFRFLVAVIVGALVIVGAAYLNTWLGVAAAVVAVAGIIWWLMQEPVPGVADPSPRLTSSTPGSTHRVLVVAAPTTSSVSVPSKATEVVVLVPALASRLEAVTGAVDDRRAEAEATARRLAGQLRNARGEVGADNPSVAVEDALRTFGADEIVVAGDDEFCAAVTERVTIPVTRA